MYLRVPKQLLVNTKSTLLQDDKAKDLALGHSHDTKNTTQGILPTTINEELSSSNARMKLNEYNVKGKSYVFISCSI